MNPTEIERDIRCLELMLYGGTPLRPDADFGMGEVGYFESVKARSPEVRVAVGRQTTEPEIVVESRIITREGKMVVGGPKPNEGH
jgi:hypothetical protein